MESEEKKEEAKGVEPGQEMFQAIVGLGFQLSQLAYRLYDLEERITAMEDLITNATQDEEELEQPDAEQ